MKTLFFALALMPALTALSATDESINKSFAVAPGGALSVDVDFGSIEVNTSPDAQNASVSVWRKITRRREADEQAFLRDYPVQISQDGATLTIRARSPQLQWSWFSWFRSRNEAKYIITLPARFDATLKTSGGSITVSDVNGAVKADTSGGSLNFAGITGPIDGKTSGGSIRAEKCEGAIRVHTSGGSIRIAQSSGELNGGTSGGSIRVESFKGPVKVHTSGGSVGLDGVAGRIEASTSGGSVHAELAAAATDSVSLSTSGGSVTFEAPANSSFTIDAETSGGRVRTDFPVTVQGELKGNRLVGTVNGGGPSVRLRTSGGNVNVNKR